MVTAFVFVLSLMMSMTAFAQSSGDDPNLPPPSQEELRSEESLSAFNKICVSANCYNELSSGWDIGQCSSPPILPEGAVDPCQAAKTATAETEANETAR